MSTIIIWAIPFHGTACVSSAVPWKPIDDSSKTSYEPYRDHILMYVLYQNRLCTREFLFRRGWKYSNFCPLYSESETCPLLAGHWAAAVHGTALRSIYHQSPGRLYHSKSTAPCWQQYFRTFENSQCQGFWQHKCPISETLSACAGDLDSGLTEVGRCPMLLLYTSSGDYMWFHL